MLREKYESLLEKKFVGLSFLSMIASGIFHILIIVILMISFTFYSKPIIIEKIYTVDILPISNRSNIKNTVKEQKQPKINDEKKEEVKKSAPQPVEKKEEKPPKKPEKKEEEVTNKKQAVLPNKKAEKQKQKKKEDPIKDKKKKKNEDDDFDSLLKNLQESKPQIKENAEKAKENAKGPYNEKAQLSISLEDDIRRQLSACWTPPSGGLEAQNMAVLVGISLGQDGSVLAAEVLKEPNGGNERMRRASIDAAIRAVKKCSPLQNLPKDTYDSWKQLEFNFDPKDLIY